MEGNFGCLGLDFESDETEENRMKVILGYAKDENCQYEMKRI